jgi:hypothetical protein
MSARTLGLRADRDEKSSDLTCPAPARRIEERRVIDRDTSLQPAVSFPGSNLMLTMTTEPEQLIGKVIGDLGGTANAALVIVDDRLGLYRTLAEVGLATSHERPAGGELQLERTGRRPDSRPRTWSFP